MRLSFKNILLQILEYYLALSNSTEVVYNTEQHTFWGGKIPITIDKKNKQYYKTGWKYCAPEGGDGGTQSYLSYS